MRANIYSLSPLEVPTMEAVEDGLGMVAAYIGETVLSSSVTVRLPLTTIGLVDTLRVGTANLDPMVELHVFAIPMVESGERVGIATLGEGVSFVDIKGSHSSIIRNVTAHEIAHSLGFVLKDSRQSDKTSEAHCIDESCIMHRLVVFDEQEVQTIEDQKLTDRLLRRRPSVHTALVRRILNDQYDFCIDCKVDLREEGQEQLNQIRYERLTSKKV